MVVTLTGGERGDILNPAMDLPEVHGRIHEIRIDEMARAAEILGVEHDWLGFVDSGLPEGDPLPPLPEGCFALVPLAESTERLVRSIREFKPHVLTTYDENGGYPHPDHIRCHEVSMAAYEAAADYRLFPDAGRAVERLEAVLQPRLPAEAHAGCSRTSSPRTARRVRSTKWLKDWDPELDVTASRITTSIECAKYFAQRDDALLRARHADRPEELLLHHADGVAAAAVADRGVRAGALPRPRDAARGRPVRRDRAVTDALLLIVGAARRRRAARHRARTSARPARSASSSS